MRETWRPGSKSVGLRLAVRQCPGLRSLAMSNVSVVATLFRLRETQVWLWAACHLPVTGSDRIDSCCRAVIFRTRASNPMTGGGLSIHSRSCEPGSTAQTGASGFSPGFGQFQVALAPPARFAPLPGKLPGLGVHGYNCAGPRRIQPCSGVASFCPGIRSRRIDLPIIQANLLRVQRGSWTLFRIS